MGPPAYAHPHPDGTSIEVFVQPKAAKDALVGVHGVALKLKIKAPPLDGRANAAAARFLASLLAIPASEVALLSGEASRHKRFIVRGLSPVEVGRRLRPVLSSRAHEPGSQAHAEEGDG